MRRKLLSVVRTQKEATKSILMKPKIIKLTKIQKLKKKSEIVTNRAAKITTYVKNKFRFGPIFKILKITAVKTVYS